MRRFLVAALTAVLILALVGGACARPAPSPSPAPAPAPRAAPAAVPMPWEKWPVERIPSEWGWPEFFVANGFATFYADAVAMAELVKKYSGMKTQVVQIGSGSKGVMAVIKGDALFNMVDAAVVNAAFLGKADFEGTKPGGTRVLASAAIGNRAGMYVRPAAGIKTPNDLRGKRVAYPLAIPAYIVMNDAILKAYGMTRKDIKEVEYSSVDALPNMLRQNLVDMFVYTAAPGTPVAVEMTQTGDAALLSIDADKIDSVEAATGGLYPKASVPAGTFKGQDREVILLSILILMHARADIPDSLAYTLTRVLWEHDEEFRSMASAQGKTFLTVKGATAPTGLKAGFHAGAVRYYREKGVWGAEQDRIQQKFEEMLTENLQAWQKKQKP